MDPDERQEAAQSCVNLIEQIQEILGEYFSPTAPFEVFLNDIETYARCQVLNALRIQHSKDTATIYPFEPSNIESVEIEDEVIQELPKNRKRAADDEEEGKIDLPERKLIKFIKNPLERLNAILALEDKVPTVDGMGISCNLSKVVIKLEMTLGAYDFVRQCLKPVRLCLDNHFNGDKAKFLEHWVPTDDQRFSFTNFYNSCTGIENLHNN